jgi:hypothetical protein
LVYILIKLCLASTELQNHGISFANAGKKKRFRNMSH